jgi:hypothetical protein
VNTGETLSESSIALAMQPSESHTVAHHQDEEPVRAPSEAGLADGA